VKDGLTTGLRVWTIPQPSVPSVTVAFVVDRGTSADPSGRPGLAGVAVDLLDEGAAGRTAIELADAFGNLGCELHLDVGPDVTTLSFSSIARVMPAALGLLSDVVRRPSHGEPDFRRVIELRKHRLQQRSRSASAVADRVLATAVFGSHPYGHGALGTTASLDAIGYDEARQFWTEACAPESAVLIVSGDVDPATVSAAAEASFGDWSNPGFRAPVPLSPAPPPDGAVRFVDRPGAAQSELRVGHLGPARPVAEYHGLLVLDAMLGGQFSSRINRNLREQRGLTYGARTSFGFRRFLGSFACESSVQSDRTAEAAAEVLREFEAIREEPVSTDELARARAALSRGYVRQFETATQYVRAAIQLVTYRLDDRTFDRFVPAIEAVGLADVQDLARRFIRPAEAAVVVVGDSGQCLQSLEGLGRPVSVVTPEF
jgi:zinc protease